MSEFFAPQNGLGVGARPAGGAKAATAFDFPGLKRENVFVVRRCRVKRVVRKLVGVQDLEILSQTSKCDVPHRVATVSLGLDWSDSAKAPLPHDRLRRAPPCNHCPWFDPTELSQKL